MSHPAYALLANYKTAWGRRTPKQDRAVTRLETPHYTEAFVLRYGVSYADLNFLRQLLIDLREAKDSRKEAKYYSPIPVETVQRAYNILARMDEHGKLRRFSVERYQECLDKLEWHNMQLYSSIKSPLKGHAYTCVKNQAHLLQDVIADVILHHHHRGF